MSIFDTLEADSRQVNNTWLTTDFKGYFKNYPYPTQYKQAWLIKRVLELEGTNAGKTIKDKENEITNLQKIISDLQSKLFNANNELIRKDTKIGELIKVAEAEKKYLIKRTNEQIRATTNFYLNSIHHIPDNEANLINDNAKLKQENNKLLINLGKTNWKFRKELVETLADVKHLRNDLTSTILDKLHVEKELDKVRKELDDILNKPTSEMGTQTDLTNEDLKDFANSTLKGLENIWDQIDLVAHYPGNNPAIEKAKKISKNFNLWLNGYKNEWSDVLEAIGGYNPTERERERESKPRKLRDDWEND